MVGNSMPTDLLDLPTPCVSEVIQSLVYKYENSEIYTWLGSNILISINPKNNCLQNYSCDGVNDYTEIHNCWRKPHVYSVAEACLWQMTSTGSNQSIIITGTSGSGKTEATKHILHYLTYKSSVKRKKQTRKTEVHIENIILQSNPILEALGNAQTQFNENSSRFGKYIRLIYDRNQILVGARLQIYLLEKPRALFTPKSLFSSFHIFRWFLESLSNEDRVKFGLDNCHYTRSDDEAYQRSRSNWSALLKAFLSLSIKEERLVQFCQLLAIILLLNSIRFFSCSPTVNIDLKNSSCSSDPHLHSSNSSDQQQLEQYYDDPAGLAVIPPDDINQITIAGRLLGIPDGEALDSLPQQFTTRLVQAGSSSQRSRRMTTYRCACTVSQAREQRDCFVKALYSSLFHYMVDEINKQLNFEDPEGPFYELGILDLFGFECLNENSFEQYCINYANERLHQTFIRIAITTAYDELEAEGLSIYPMINSDEDSLDNMKHDNTMKNKQQLNCSIKLCDNTLTLKAIEVNANLLEEVCLLNRVHNVNSSKLLSSTGSLSQLDPREIDWISKIQSAFTTPNCSIHLYDNGCIQSPCCNAKKIPLSSSRVGKQLTSTTSGCRPIAIYDHFLVKHYGGPVVYSVSGFVAKNLDRIPVQLLTWIKEESCLAEYDTDNLIYLVLCNAMDTANQMGVTTTSYQSETPVKIRSALQQINNHIDNSPRTPMCNSLVVNNASENSISPTNRRINTRRLNTVFGNFKSSLDHLLDVLNCHNLFFIRCIRPDSPSRNCHQSINCLIDSDYVKDQLVNSGLLAALEVLRSTYYAKFTYEEFISEYRVFWHLNPYPPTDQLLESEFCLLNSWYLKLIQLPRSTSKRTPLTLRRQTSESTIQQQQQFVLILLMLGLNLSSISSKTIPIDNNLYSIENDENPNPIYSAFPIIYQFGRTRIHLTKSQYQHLTKLRYFMLNRNAKVIQLFFKRCLRHKAAKRIQHWWRKLLANRELMVDKSNPVLYSSLSDADDDDDEDSSQHVDCDTDSFTTSPSVLSNAQTSEIEIEETKIGQISSSTTSVDLPTIQRYVISRRYLPRLINNTTLHCQYSCSNNSSNNFRKQSNLLNYLIPFCYKNHILRFYEALEPVKGIFDIICE